MHWGVFNAFQWVFHFVWWCFHSTAILLEWINIIKWGTTVFASPLWQQRNEFRWIVLNYLPLGSASSALLTGWFMFSIQNMPYLLSFSFWEWAPSSADPTGSSITFLPVASWKVKVTGMLPPSLVKSGSTPNTRERERYSIKCILNSLSPALQIYKEHDI